MNKKTKLIVLRILFIISLIISLLLINGTYAKYQEQMDTSYKSMIKRWKIIVNDKVVREHLTLNEIVTPILVDNEYVSDDVIVPGREGYFDMEIDFSKVDVPFTVDFTLEQNATSDTYNNLPDFKFFGYYVEENDSFYYKLPEQYKQVEYIELDGEKFAEENKVACYRIEDDKIGVYDMITGEFTTDFEATTVTKGEDLEKIIINPRDEKYKDLTDEEKNTNVKAYVKWVDGDGTTESPIDILNNTEDTAFVDNVNNTEVQYRAIAVFEQYIEE